MSQFNKFGRKFDKIARTAFDEYITAADKLKVAEDHRRQYPQRNGAVSADYAASCARAEACYLDAVSELDRVRRKLDEGEYRQQINALRKELASAVELAFMADPEQIDAKTLTLLESGILTPHEYASLFEKASKSGNSTMMRVVGAYAEKAATSRAEKYGENDEAASNLRLVSYKSHQSAGDVFLQAFDGLTTVYRMCIENMPLINKWDELTATTVENF